MKKLLLLLAFLFLSFFAPAQVIRFGNEYPIWSEYGMNNFQEQLDLSAMSNGIYFVSVKVDDSIVLTKKVVKSN